MSLAGVLGNRDLVAGLSRELERRPSHAYLLAGPRGIGKSLIAKGLAHNILCERARGPDFCCTVANCPVRQPAAGRGRAATPTIRCACCDACVQLAAGVHPDYTYVSRAENRSDVLIEQVRGLIDHLGVRPAPGPRRVAIIDDAETLNLPAQNALLKTLEEPPGATLIFLVSNSERALLDTIRSRTRPVRFAALETAEVAALLVARGIETDRANAIARLARGSVSRARELAEGASPPAEDLLSALSRARALDFDGAQALAQEFFGGREQAADNFELIARLLDEVLSCKVLGTAPEASGPDTAKMMAQLALQLEISAIAELAARALAARAAVEAMANSRLQAEQWWMAASAALRGEYGC
jgi:DNA polymerase-3 subunit delta'